MEAVKLNDVWLKYRIEFKRQGRSHWEDFWALRGFGFTAEKGDSIAVIGENGSGKTTALKVISGMLKADRGSVQVNGTVSTLMDIGSGFQRELTGRENIYAISSLFGFSRPEVNRRYEEIARFAALGRFIDAPVKVYSQGMYMRLAFAIAIHVDPDILLVDDIFSVGDSYAQRKCIDKMFALKEAGKTIIFVTHELETAKRFCEKGILVKDGRVIKEGPLKQVASYYLKTVGNKSGIGILQGKNIGSVFNNGKLLINWQDEALTRESAGHLLVLKGGNWYSSLQADWEVKQDGPGHFVGEAAFWELALKQVWEVSFEDEENALDIRISMDSAQDLEVEEISACFLFGDNYKCWFSPVKNGKFVPDSLDGQACWQCTDPGEDRPGYIGLAAGAPLPVVVMEDLLYLTRKILEVHNTDRVLKSRALQSRIISTPRGPVNIRKGRQLLFHLRIRLFHDREAMEKYLEPESRRWMLPKAISAGEMGLSAGLNNSALLSCGGRSITSSQGFKSNFWCGGKLYQSSDAQWAVHRISDKKLEVTMRWPDLALRKTWEFEFTGEDVLSWRVYLELEEAAGIRNSESRLMFSPGYGRWVTSSGEGDIIAEVSTEDFKNIIMQNDPRNILGLQGTGELPSLTMQDTSGRTKFSYLDKIPDNNVSISKGLNVSEMTTQVCFLDPGWDRTLGPGKHLLSDIRILVSDPSGQAAYIRKEGAMRPGASLECGSLRFSFEGGRGRVFWEGKELTRGFGLYTSVYSTDFLEHGQWHASLDAIWEVLGCKKNRMLLRGSWPYLPMRQIWEIALEERRIKWKVELEILSELALEKQQSYLMLSPAYSGWQTSAGDSGEFPQEFSLSSWDGLCKESSADRIVALQADSLPQVSFSCLRRAQGLFAAVENSSLTFKGRVIGFEKSGQGSPRVPRGRHRYFEGQISF